MSIELTKKETSSLKGIAILLMLYLHFFQNSAQFALHRERVDSLFLLCQDYSRYGLACIAIFSFITGYGYCALSTKETSSPIIAGVKRLRNLYPFFVFMCVLFYCLGHIFPYGNILHPDDWTFFAKNLTGVYGTIPDYWYIRIVLVSALLYYPILLATRRTSHGLHAFINLSLIVITYATMQADGVIQFFSPASLLQKSSDILPI